MSEMSKKEVLDIGGESDCGRHSVHDPMFQFSDRVKDREALECLVSLSLPTSLVSKGTPLTILSPGRSHTGTESEAVFRYGRFLLY